MHTNLSIRPGRFFGFSIYQTERSVDRSIASSEHSLVNVEISWDTLQNKKDLDFQGQFGKVQKAKMGKTQVVIKRLRPEFICDSNKGDQLRKEFETEINLHSRLYHDNIVKVMGLGLTRIGEKFLVLEFLECGDLANLTRSRKNEKIPYLKVLDIAIQIARGMNYCHRIAVSDSMVIHTDLKLANIGMKKHGTVKILDFGFATLVENSSADSDEKFDLDRKGTKRYMAPEVLRSEAYNHKADVYSFSLILWELMELAIPFADHRKERDLEESFERGDRPLISDKFPEDFNELVQKCWSTDADDRPNFDELVRNLQEIVTKEKKR